MTCVKCGFSGLVDGVRILRKQDLGEVDDLTVVVHEHPDALLFSGKVASVVRGRACGNCGYLELYVTNPAQLYAAARRSTGG